MVRRVNWKPGWLGTLQELILAESQLAFPAFHESAPALACRRPLTLNLRGELHPILSVHALVIFVTLLTRPSPPLPIPWTYQVYKAQLG